MTNQQDTMNITISVTAPKFAVGDTVQFVDYSAPAGFPVIQGIVRRRYIHAYEIAEGGDSDCVWMYGIEVDLPAGMKHQCFIEESDLFAAGEEVKP